MTPDVGAQLQQYIAQLQTALVHHGFLRGTFEAALAESQGLQLIGPNAKMFQHLLSMEQAVRATRAPLTQIGNLLTRLRSIDPRAATVIGDSLRNLLTLARERIALAQATGDLIFELKATGNSVRLAGAPVATAARTTTGMVSHQLRQLWQGLVPAGLQSALWVRLTLERIRLLPLNAAQAAAQVAAAAVVARTMLMAALLHAQPGLLQRIAAGLKGMWNAAGRLTTVILVPVDENGRIIGDSGPRGTY